MRARIHFLGGETLWPDSFTRKIAQKEEKVLQGIIDKLIEIGSCYGMEMNVEKNKSNENFKTAIPSNNYDRPKTTGECGMF